MKKFIARYKFAVYASLFLGGILLYFFATKYTGNVNALLINLSTELLGVVLLFFLLDFVFSMGNLQMEELTEKIGQLLNEKGIVGVLKQKQSVNMGDDFEEADQINIFSMTLTTTFGKYRELINRKVIDKKKINLIICNPDSEAPNTLASESDGNSASYYIGRISSSIEEAKKIKRIDDSSSFDLKLIDFVPSYSLYIFSRTGKITKIYVELFAHGDGWKNQPWIVINSKENEGIQFFNNQFEILWTKSKNYNF